MLVYELLFSYLQLRRSYGILGATTQHFGRWWTSGTYDVNWVVVLNMA